MKKRHATILPTAAPHILAIEASANQLSIAMMINGELVAERHHPAMHGHAVSIVPLSIETAEDVGMTFDAVTHVAAGCGPGHQGDAEPQVRPPGRAAGLRERARLQRSRASLRERH